MATQSGRSFISQFKNPRFLVYGGSILAFIGGAFAFGESVLNYLSKEPAATSSDQSNEAGNKVSHVIQHRSGTQDGDLLTGDDNLILTEKTLREPESYMQNLDWVDFDDMPLNHACGVPYRLLNTTNEYVSITMGYYASDHLWKFAIGPGERSAQEVGNGNFVVMNDDGEVIDYFRVSDCPEG